MFIYQPTEIKKIYEAKPGISEMKNKLVCIHYSGLKPCTHTDLFNFYIEISRDIE